MSIVLLNVLFYAFSQEHSFPGIQQRGDATGFAFSSAKQFAYFHYYTSDFPLATLNSNLVFTEDGARNEIQNNGEQLIMEYQHWSRLGESARIWAFLPNSIVRGSPENPSIKLFNAFVFTLSMMVLYLGFLRLKKVLFGLLLIVCIQFTPFYLYETYSHENIFGLAGATFFLILGLHVFSLYKEEKTYVNFILICISGIIIGFFSEMRNEISIVMVSLLLTSLFLKQKNFIVNIGIAAIGLGAFFITKNTIRSHFQQKYQNTLALVKEAGGHPYTGAISSGHSIWHPLFCGLGDFDNTYGFEWDDKTAYTYAIPILKEKYGMQIEYSDKYHLDQYYDENKLYYIKPEDLDNYEQVVKEKVLEHISNDPLWYATIIFKRIYRTLTVTIPIPYIGLGIFFLFYFFFRKKQWSDMNLLIVSLPLSATSILVYSGNFSTYNSVFVYIVLVSLAKIFYDKRRTSALQQL